jgi:hypothetical protein
MAVVEAKAKTDFDRLKEAFTGITISDVRPIVLASVSSLRDIGAFIEAIGKLQKKSNIAYELINEMGENPEAILLQFIDRLPEEKLRSMIEFSLKLSSIQAELKNFKDLSADQKIELGAKMKELTEGFAKIIGELPE